MNQKLIERKQRFARKRPLGFLAAMITGSLTALIGIFQNGDPGTILVRTLLSALLMGGIVSCGMVMVRLANIRNEVH